MKRLYVLLLAVGMIAFTGLSQEPTTDTKELLEYSIPLSADINLDVLVHNSTNSMTLEELFKDSKMSYDPATDPTLSFDASEGVYFTPDINILRDENRITLKTPFSVTSVPEGYRLEVNVSKMSDITKLLKLIEQLE